MVQEWECLECGYVEDGPRAPLHCPECGASRSQFQRTDLAEEDEDEALDLIDADDDEEDEDLDWDDEDEDLFDDEDY